MDISQNDPKALETQLAEILEMAVEQGKASGFWEIDDRDTIMKSQNFGQMEVLQDLVWVNLLDPLRSPNVCTFIGKWDKKWPLRLR